MMDFDITSLIGLTEDKARELCGWNGYSMRVLTIDGHPRVVTRDIKTDRVGVHLENGIVTQTTIG